VCYCSEHFLGAEEASKLNANIVMVEKRFFCLYEKDNNQEVSNSYGGSYGYFSSIGKGNNTLNVT